MLCLPALMSSFVMMQSRNYCICHIYDGPYKVLEQTDKFYYVDINGRHDTVSLDHLKSAYYESQEMCSQETQSLTPPSPTYY